MTTLDFNLEISPGDGHTYLVMARALGSEATVTIRLPETLDELDHQLAVIRAEVLSSSEVGRGAPAAGERLVRELGQRLFDALITDEVRSLYVASSQQAHEQGGVLRLVLQLHSPELARLPWEFLFDPRRQDYLGLNLPLVRYAEVLAPRQPLPVAAPLRILGMAVCAHEQNTQKVGEEQRRLRAALAGLERDGLVELSWVAGPTYDDLKNALNLGPWHVFHFVGHGKYDQATGAGILALTDDTGRAHLVGVDDFSRLLADHHPLRLVVLNTCDAAACDIRAGDIRVGDIRAGDIGLGDLEAEDTGWGSTSDAFSSMAEALLRRWIPAVVAMQCETTDQASIVFSQTFYKNVAKQLAVDTSVVRARQALKLVKKDTLEWGTPALYLCALDGRIFDTSSLSVLPPGHSHEKAAPGDDDADTLELEALYDEALAAFWTERWDQAIALLRKVLARHPHHADAATKLEQAGHQRWLAAQYRAGLRLLDTGQWEQAVDALIRLDSGYRDTAALLARARKELTIPHAAPLDLPRLIRHPKVVRTVHHGEAVTEVAFSPDGHWLATASHDETARIWDLNSGRERLSVRHKGMRSNVRGRPVNVRGRAVQGMALSHDGRLLATGSDDYTARIWNATTGHQLARFAHDNVVMAVAFSPDGRLLATASEDRVARIWDAASGKKLATLTHDSQVYGVAFTPDGNRVVTGSGDHSARIWAADSGEKLATIIHDKAVLGVAFSPDGRMLATACDDHTARVWGTGTGEQIATFTHGNRVWAVTFSPDSSELATASDDYTARIWDIGDGGQVAILTHDNQVYGVAYSSDGKWLATACRDKAARIWSLDQDDDE